MTAIAQLPLPSVEIFPPVFGRSVHGDFTLWIIVGLFGERCCCLCKEGRMGVSPLCTLACYPIGRQAVPVTSVYLNRQRGVELWLPYTTMNFS